MKRFCLLMLLLTALVPNIDAGSVMPLAWVVPDSLKEGASSIVCLDRVEVELKSLTEATQKYTRVVAIYNKNAADAGWFSCACNKYTKLKSFKGTLYDKTGAFIREFDKSKLIMSEYSANLATDSYGYMLQIQGSSYPYFVEYEWELECKNGIRGFPAFDPIDDYRQSLMGAKYSISVPAEMGIAFKAFNMPDSLIKETKTPERIGVSIELKGVKAIVPEAFSGKLSAKRPRVMVAPRVFAFDKTRGDLSSWETLGNWVVGLVKDRDVLKDSEKAKIHAMTDTCATLRDKAKVLYEYLKDTRYVNISLGIGGYQPAPAQKVAEWKFGDCKGLSNYMCAMLREVGMEAWNVTISTEDETLHKDFPSFQQLNHMIACVVLPEDTIWLECTNPVLPFGYIHESIAGHDATVIDEKGSYLVKLPSYPDSLSYTSKYCEITYNPVATATLKVDECHTLEYYENALSKKNAKNADLVEYLRDLTGISDGVVENVVFDEYRTSTPSLKMSYSITGKRFGRRSGRRLFVPVNVFRSGRAKYTVSDSERKYSFVFVHEMVRDTIVVNVPEGYAVESTPGDVEISTPYLDFNSTVSVEPGKVVIVQCKHFKKGEYTKELEAEFAENYNKMLDAYNDQIILRRSN